MKITILIVFYILVILYDGFNTYKTGSKVEIIFNILVYCGTFIVLLLYSMDIFLPSVAGFITEVTEQVYAQLGLSSFISNN